MAVFDWLEQGIVARPDIDYLNSTGALYPIGPRRESLLPDYETLADRALIFFHEDREHFPRLRAGQLRRLVRRKWLVLG